MAQRNRSWFGRIADIFIPGDAYNSNTGKWNPAQVKVGLVSLAAGLAYPGAGMLINQGANKGLFGSKLKQLLSGNSSGFRNFETDPVPSGNTPNGGIGGIAREVFKPDTGLTINQLNPSIRPSNSTLTISPDAGGDVNLGTSTAGIFSGGSLGSWANNATPQITNRGRAGGAFTPHGAGIVQVAGQDWSGSDAAAGYGLGAQGSGASSAGSYALADAMVAAKKNRR